MISAKVIADSITKQGDRITTMLVTMPRIILAEFNTHRAFSRNTASSRAIPFEKMYESVEKHPFVPIAWQKDHKGMQGTEYLSGDAEQRAILDWISAKYSALAAARSLNEFEKVTKQIANRLLEPFMWSTVVVTSTEWENFFDLRCPQYTINWYPENRPEALEPSQVSFRSKRDAFIWEGENVSSVLPLENDVIGWLQINYGNAEIHMMALAEEMWDALNESTPAKLEPGEWHIPFGDQITEFKNMTFYAKDYELFKSIPLGAKVKVSTAMCARTSYTIVGAKDKKPNYEADIQLHDFLLAQQHLSPFEHCAMAPHNFNKDYGRVQPGIEKRFSYSKQKIEYWSGNFRGWIQYRQLIDNKF